MAALSEIAARIERLRVARGLSQTALSTAAGLSPGGVWDIVANPTRSPRLSTLDAIAGALGVGLAELVGQSAPVVGGLTEVAGGGEFAAAVQIDGLRLYRATGAGGCGHGVREGDLIAVKPGAVPESGDLILAESGRNNGQRETVIAFFSDPLVFEIHGGAPRLIALDSGDVIIIGPVLWVFRNFQTHKPET